MTLANFFAQILDHFPYSSNFRKYARLGVSGSGSFASSKMSDHPDDLGMEEDLSLSNTMLDPTKPNDYDIEDYTLKRETDSYVDAKDDNSDETLSQATDKKDGEKNENRRRRVRRYRDGHSFYKALTHKEQEIKRELDVMESREPQENSEEEQIIRLPSETEMTDVTHQRSHSESMSNFYPIPGYRRNDCLNFTQQNRELTYIKHAEVFENWKYSDEERAFLRHRVETFTKEQCVIHCILGHMLMCPEELEGIRHTIPIPDDARQALLSLAIGSHWDVFNLAIIMAFSEKLNEFLKKAGDAFYRAISEDARAVIEDQIKVHVLDDTATGYLLYAEQMC